MEHEGNFLLPLLAVDAGVLFGLLMMIRRRRARLAGRPLEQHDLWRHAPLRYLTWWIPLIGLGVAVFVKGEPMLSELLALGAMAAMVIATGLLMAAERRAERASAA
jgi:hypothetical protein